MTVNPIFDALTVNGQISGGGNAVAITATNSVSARTAANRFADVFNVKDYGATGNGSVDDRPAINAAIAAASSIGGEVYFPAGTYRIDLSAGCIVPASNVTMRGSGIGRSVIYEDDTNGFAGSPGHAGITNIVASGTFGATVYTYPGGSTSYVPLYDFHIKSLTFKGTRSAFYTQGAQLSYFFGAYRCGITESEFRESRSSGIVFQLGDEITISGNKIYQINSDGIDVWDVPNLLIDGNEFHSVSDDAIGVSSDDAAPTPVRSGVVISNNRITECQGISCLGAKNTIITGNILRRCMSYGIVVYSAPGYTQGNTPIFGVKIVGNIISDVFLRSEPSPLNQAQWYIAVGGSLRSAGSAGSPPGFPTAGTGNVPSIFGTLTGQMYANATAAGTTASVISWIGNPTVSSPGGHWIEVTDNQLVRTLPAVATFSQWGYGSALFVGNSGTNGSYNGPISESALNTPGISIRPSLRNSRISRNTIQTTGPYGIYWEPNLPTMDLDYDGLSIEGNTIVDFSSAGIYGPQSGTHRVSIIGNTFDGDPNMKSTNRFFDGNGNPDGSWASPLGTLPVRGIFVALCNGGFVIEKNSFRNVLVPFLGGSGFDPILGNKLYGDFAFFGFGSANKGIGNVPAPNAGWLYIFEDSNPQSATYGKIQSEIVFSSSAQPNTGKYLQGHFVQNYLPAVSGGKVLMGWVRLTNGSSHVAGVDWSPIYSSTS